MPNQKTTRFAKLTTLLRALSPGELRAFAQLCRAGIARTSDSPTGFDHFYRLIFDRPLPPHARAEWIEPLYAAQATGKGLVIEAFRGSTKTTSVTIAFVAFRIGQQPQKSNLLIQVGDDIAKDNAQQIADLIAHNPGWKLVFPSVLPDRKVGWGRDGYEVLYTDLDYAEWRAQCAREKGKDPTFIGLGYKSRAIIGKHPTGILVVDDIHDENNTRSAAELETVIKIVTGTLMPTLTPESWKVFIGTPWALDDVLAYIKSTGEFNNAKTPILRDIDNESVPTWPERFSWAEIEKQRALAGEVEFARMFLLDLEAASGVHLKAEWLHKYPYAQIDPSWPVVMGVDYASAADQTASNKRDYCAIAIGCVLPGGGGGVLVDGFRGKVSQGAAEEQLKQLTARYPTTQMIGVEAVGKGEEFYHLMLRRSRLPVTPCHTGGKSKGLRFERGMAPLFQSSRAFIADIQTPFLKAFQDEWVRWPHAPHDDTLDAVYWMLYTARTHLLGSSEKPKDTRSNPFGSLARG